MLVERDVCEKYLSSEIFKLDKNRKRDVMDNLYKEYNIPQSDTSDFLSMRKSLFEASNFFMFCLVRYFNQNKVNEFFTENEIIDFSSTRLIQEQPIEFPIRINCIQVAPDQWIGATDLDFFIRLKKARLVKYNTDTQRTMSIVKKGKEVFYKITVYVSKIKKIAALMTGREYVPDDITLNILPSSNYKMDYDKENKQLVIHQIDMFDIIDGYHRFLALGECEAKDENFNYPMEIRITNFEETKAKRFIYQKSKATPMKEIDTESMDMSKHSNIVIDRLNEDTLFYMKGCISRDNGQIPYAYLSECINYYYFKDVKDVDNSYVVQVKNEIRNKFNALTEVNSELLDNAYSFPQLIIILYGFRTLDDNAETYEKINQALTQAESLDKRKLTRGKVTKNLNDDVTRIFNKLI